MTYEEAKTTHRFRHDYQDNCAEREAWGDEVLTPEQFFEVWTGKDQSCDSLKKHSTQ
jgi:hypothetical protein